MQTKDKFMEQERKAIGESDFQFMKGTLDNEYYGLVEEEVKKGNKISQEVYESLSKGQKFHFNKHHNSRFDKIEE